MIPMKNRFLRNSLTFFVVFLMTVGLLFYFNHSKFKENSPVELLGDLTRGFVRYFKEMPLIVETLDLFDYKVTGHEEEFTEYKLTVVSKSIAQYFSLLLEETQELLHRKNISQVVLSGGKWGSWEGTKDVLQGYLSRHIDVLEFSVYSDSGEKVIGAKYQSIPNYELGVDVRRKAIQGKNILFRHKQSRNLILLSSIVVEGQPAFFVTQTLHPVFFSRILDYLEIDEELFYIKSGSSVMIDNSNAVKWTENLEAVQTKGKSSLAGFYSKLVYSEERVIELNTDVIDYRLGTVVKRNNTWGNLFVLGLISLFFVINFYLLSMLFHLFFPLSFARYFLKLWKQSNPQPREKVVKYLFFFRKS